jgi:hypothetical protein
VVLASRSSFTDTLDVASATCIGDPDGMTSGELVGPDDQSLRVPPAPSISIPEHRHEVLVAGDGRGRRPDAAFRWSVALTLAALGIGLVIATPPRSAGGSGRSTMSGAGWRRSGAARRPVSRGRSQPKSSRSPRN